MAALNRRIVDVDAHRGRPGGGVDARILISESSSLKFPDGRGRVALERDSGGEAGQVIDAAQTLASSFSWENAVALTGTSCRRSVRRVAVTTISSRPLPPEEGIAVGSMASLINTTCRVREPCRAR